MKNLSLAVLAVVLTACGSGAPGTTSGGRQIASPTVSAGDREWLSGMHQANLADIQYGRLAARRGGTTAVRHAGNMLVADHTALDQKVTGVAADLGVDLPASQRTDQLALARRLENAPTGRFDRDFVSALTAEHEKAIATTEDEVRNGSAPQVTALARTALPGLREHLAMLRKANPVG